MAAGAGPRVRAMQRTASRKGPGPGPGVSGPSLPSGVGVGAARWAADPRLTAGPAARPLPRGAGSGPSWPAVGDRIPAGAPRPLLRARLPCCSLGQKQGARPGRADQYSRAVSPAPGGCHAGRKELGPLG